MTLRLGVLTSHPIQYQAPLFRKLAKLAQIQVYFAQRSTPAEQATAGFGVRFDWDTDLLSGYPSEFLANRARQPHASRFFGCDTPEIAKKIHDGKFDAFLVMGWHLKAYWQAVDACRKRRIPVMVRGDSQLAMRPPIVAAVKRPLYRWMLNHFDACLAVGLRSKEYYRYYGVPENRIYLSPHCVDDDLFYSSAKRWMTDREALRRSLGIRQGAKVLLFVGKLTDRKRPFDVIRSLRMIADRGYRADLLIVGSGPLEQELRKLASSHHVIFAGFKNQSEIPAYYAASDLLVLPSARETWGLVVNEAMVCGVPAVVSDAVGCGPDLICHKTGRIYPVSSVSALTDQILEFWPRLGTPEAAIAVRLKIAAYAPELAARGIVDAARGTMEARDEF